MAASKPKTEKIVFGAGCFWGTEELFRRQVGVVATRAGYAGGHVEHPTYEQVCSHTTGHAEVVEVTYDPKKIALEKLLSVFWTHHDPTTPNRQGNDVGNNYRSVIFYTTEEQKKAALASKEVMEHSGQFNRPIVTKIEKAGPFWEAEEYHQKYLVKNPGGYCHIKF